MITKDKEWDAKISQLIKESNEKARLEKPVDEALYWTEALILQCQRVIDLRNWSKAKTSDWTRHTTDRLETLSLLNVAGKVMRWILDAEPNPKWDRSKIDSFNNLLEGLRQIRNKREHDEKYGVGKKLEPLRDATADGSNLKLMVGPNVTVFRGDQILIGGVVDVHKLHDAAIKAADVFRQVQNKQAPAKHFKKKPGIIGPGIHNKI